MNFLIFGLSCINVPRLWCPSEITKDWRQQGRGVLSPFINEILLRVLSVLPSKGCAWIPKLDPLQLRLCFPSVLSCPGEAAFSRGAVDAPRKEMLHPSNPVCFIQYYRCSMHRVRTNPAAAWAVPKKKLSLGADPSSWPCSWTSWLSFLVPAV